MNAFFKRPGLTPPKKPRVVKVTEPALEEKAPPSKEDHEFLEEHPTQSKSK